MKNSLRKIFGGIEMTWPKVIVFSVVIAAITAIIMICPIFKGNAIQEMGIGFECWFVFAIFVISNCKSPLEAGFKTFVFFLISQPLIYLFQQPFASINLLGTYYYRWFIWTLFTFPGGIIAYYVKKDQIYSSFILAVAGVCTGTLGISYAMNHLFNGGFSYVIYGLFFVLFALVLGIIFFDKKINKIIYYIITVAVMIIVGVFMYISLTGTGKTAYDISQEGTWQITNYVTVDATVELKDEDTLVFEYARNSKCEVYLENEKGEEVEVILEVEKGNLSFEERSIDEGEKNS